MIFKYKTKKKEIIWYNCILSFYNSNKSSWEIL
jgi:hypothetical protein